MTISRVLFAVGLLICLAIFTGSFGSAQAQSIPTAPAPSDTTSAEAASTLESLLETLKDDEARAALVAELEAFVDSAPTAAEPVADVLPDETLARRIANTTSLFAEEAFGTVSAVWRDLRGIRSLFADLPPERLERISEGWLPLLLTIVSTLAVIWVLTRIVARWRGNGDASPEAMGLRERIFAVVINAVTDIVVLALAYAAASLLSFVVFGPGGEISIEQSLYLNAFLVAGVVRVVLRAFVLPDRPHQAISNFSQPVQRVIYRRAEAVTFLTVYGITAAVPIANAWISFATGRSIRIIVVTLAAIIALFAIRQVARMVAAETALKSTIAPAEPRSEEDDRDAEDVVDAISEASIQAAASAWNRIWPWLAAAYVVSVYVISVTRPRMMVEVIGMATLKTLGAVAIISIATAILRQSKTAQVRLPATLTAGLPDLQFRLQGLTAPFLRLVGAALIVTAVGLFLDAWSILDVGGWLASDAGSAFLSRVVSALLILAMVLFVWVIVSSWIDHRLNQELDGVNVTARSRTLLALFRNAFTIAIFIFGTMIALSQLGIDIAPLLAGAGVIGLAIGFGSQKLVQDIITGVFIQLENAINEGDVVTVGGISGAVEKLTIRSVGLRSLDGVYHIVPFSSVDTVSNFMRKFSFHVEVVGIAYKESVPAAKDAMFEAFARLRAIEEHGSVILDDLEMHGVVALAESSVNLRARIKTLPGKQWAVGRAYTELVKEVFDERGVEIPFPHRQMIVSRGDALE